MTNTAVARLNDAFRRSGRGGQVMITQGIQALPFADQAAIIERVRRFDAFTEDNDPYGEHDFGAFDYDGQRIFWKIDYYAPGLDAGSDNPAEPAQTVRVLTVMRAEEY